MNKADNEHEMAAEYDMRGGVRGKYSARYPEGTNIVRLNPDVLRAFPTSESVNMSLRSLIASGSADITAAQVRKLA